MIGQDRGAGERKKKNLDARNPKSPVGQGQAPERKEERRNLNQEVDQGPVLERKGRRERNLSREVGQDQALEKQERKRRNLNRGVGQSLRIGGKRKRKTNIVERNPKNPKGIKRREVTVETVLVKASLRKTPLKIWRLKMMAVAARKRAAAKNATGVFGVATQEEELYFLLP